MHSCNKIVITFRLYTKLLYSQFKSCSVKLFQKNLKILQIPFFQEISWILNLLTLKTSTKIFFTIQFNIGMFIYGSMAILSSVT